eukprot:SAG11_NODE_14379_length_614_cov_1.186408_1_plen_98_part_00
MGKVADTGPPHTAEIPLRRSPGGTAAAVGSRDGNSLTLDFADQPLVVRAITTHGRIPRLCPPLCRHLLTTAHAWQRFTSQNFRKFSGPFKLTLSIAL